MHRISAVADERGGVLLLVAIGLPALLVLLAFVCDVGNWFVHKRHLQSQADAAALAGAQEFRFPCDSSAVAAKAVSYGGTDYNAQVGGAQASRVHLLINSRTFYEQPAQPAPDDTTESPPCTAGMVDVKMTETDLPWFFRAPLAFLPSGTQAKVDFINAHARVSVNQIDSSAGSLPVGVPDVNPRSAHAWFIDEATGTVLGSTDLTKAGTSNGLAVWDNQSAPVNVTVGSAVRDIGVVVALGGWTSTACGAPLVSCYDAGAATVNGLPATGVLHIRGWSAAGSGAQTGEPVARDVTLVNGTCSDPYFVAATSRCTIGVRARVDFGPNVTVPSSTGTCSGPPCATLTAVVNRTNYPMTYNAATGYWQSALTIPVDPGTGPANVDLNWEEKAGSIATKGNCSTQNGNKCTGTFAAAQRVFSASDARSGPIQGAEVIRDGVEWTNALERCSAVQTSCTYPLVVQVRVKGNLQNARSVSDSPVALRVVGGSQNQSLDCDPDLPKLKDELAQGCSPTYHVNTGAACPASVSTLWSSAQPWQCVAIQTGSAVNQVPSGMNTRILGTEKPSTCTAPNHWSSFPNLDPRDPRILQVLLTPFGSFGGSGSTTVPVTDFATFYVTGWTGQGQGFDNPCQGNGDDPVPNNDPGYVVGHFIKYIETINPGGGTTPCDVNAFGACVAVMTR